MWYTLLPRLLQFLAWGPTRAFFGFFCSYKSLGTQNLSGIGQAIFAVNHASELDPILLTAALSPVGRFSPMFYVGAPTANFSDERFGWRRFIYKNWFFFAWGSYPVISGLKNYEASLHSHIEILRDGNSLCMFPEGTMTKDGNLKEGHGGVCFLTHSTSIPLVPVRITGSFNMSLRAFFGRKRKIVVHFGSPLTSRDLFGDVVPTSREHFKSAASIVMSRIGELGNY